MEPAPRATEGRGAGAVTGRPPTRRSEARRLLLDLLRKGPVPARDVRAAALAAGISLSTLERAKLALGIQARPERRGPGGVWTWELP
jgi:hypothetical protein